MSFTICWASYSVFCYVHYLLCLLEFVLTIWMINYVLSFIVLLLSIRRICL